MLLMMMSEQHEAAKTDDNMMSALVGVDTMESNLALARKILVGLPCTVEIGNSQIPGEVVHVTRCTIRVRYGVSSDRFLTFSRRPGARYWSAKGCYFLVLGEAKLYSDPYF